MRWGYPGDSSSRQNLPAYDLDDVTITKGIISNRVTTKWATYEAFQMDVSIAPATPAALWSMRTARSSA